VNTCSGADLSCPTPARSLLVLGWMLATSLLVLVLATAAPLRLPELLAQVAAHAPAVQVDEAEVELGRARVGVAGAWEDPVVSVMAESLPIGPAHEADPIMISYRLGQTLNLFGRRGLAKRAARADVTRARAGLRRSRSNAQAQAVNLFYELWMVDEMARIIDAQVALLGRMREAGLALVRAGMGNMGHHDVLRAESELVVMEAERASLADEREAIVAMLNALRGLPEGEAIGAVELATPAPLAAVDVEASAALDTPEVAAARAMKERAEAERALARMMYWPMVMIEAEYEQKLDGMPDGFGVALSVTLPLWWWDRQDREVAMAGAMVRVAERDEVAMRTMAGAELRMAWSRARGAERKLDALENAAIPKLRETIGSVEAAYISGSGQFIALLDAVMQLKELESRRAAAVVERGVLRFELDRIAGRQVPR
jgi:cobalt-zinc-cadmium efflux system outer membrane protein